MSTTVSTPRKVAAAVTANATLAKGRHTPVDATGSALTVTLPTDAVAGVELSVEKVDTSANVVTISGTLRGTADSTLTLTSRFEARTFLSEGAGSWRPISDHRTATALTSATNKNLRQVSAVSHAVRADVTKLRAPNAAPMTIPSYDGSNQLTHASIVFDPDGWNGWRYWMVATPYAAANTQVENPSIYVANDPNAVGGTSGWQVPAGLTNPIDPYPGGSSFNSDPDIAWGPDGTLYVFWRQLLTSQPGSEENICVRSSTDGIHWSAKTSVITNNQASRRPVAPSVLWDGSQWVMYAVDIIPSPNVITRYTNASSNPAAGTWSGPTTVTLSGLPGYPTTREPWHIDVNKWGDQFHMLINDTAIDASGSNGSLYIASSTDGLSFTSGTTPVISQRSTQWDASLYRSSMVPALLGDEWGYEIMYAGYTGGNNYFLAHTFAGFNLHRRQVNASLGPVHGMADPNHVNIIASRIPLAPFVLGDTFARADAATLGSADSGTAWTTQAGVPGISSKQAFATTAANTKVVQTGVADGYSEITVNALGTQAWLMFRGTDASNYWRFGYTGGTLQLQKIVAGASSSPFTSNFGAFVAGDRIGVLCSGSSITVCKNGVTLVTATDTFNQAGTLVGWQTSETTSRFGPIYARNLVAGA